MASSLATRALSLLLRFRTLRAVALAQSAMALVSHSLEDGTVQVCSPLRFKLSVPRHHHFITISQLVFFTLWTWWFGNPCPSLEHGLTSPQDFAQSSSLYMCKPRQMPKISLLASRTSLTSWNHLSWTGKKLWLHVHYIPRSQKLAYIFMIWLGPCLVLRTNGL